MESILGISHYLANKPTGIVVVYLIVAVIVFVIGLVLAVWSKDLFRALVMVGMVALVLAFLT